MQKYLSFCPIALYWGESAPEYSQYILAFPFISLCFVGKYMAGKTKMHKAQPHKQSSASSKQGAATQKPRAKAQKRAKGQKRTT